MLATLVSGLASRLGKVLTILAIIGALIIWGRFEQISAHNAELKLSGVQTQLSVANTNLQRVSDEYSRYQVEEQKQLSAAQARSARTITITRTISHAPETNSCAHSPAVTAVLDGLRQSNAEHNTSAPASLPTDLRGSTSNAR